MWAVPTQAPAITHYPTPPSCTRGRNSEGQCGVESGPLVTRPTVLLDLHSRPDLGGARAGKLTSAVLTAAGEALTWGCTRAAQLGHGGSGGSGSGGGGGGGMSDGVAAPARVESLVGRAEIVAASLGDEHSIFLDRRGGVWAVGCNLDGQCGLGAPLEELAREHRRAWAAAHGLGGAAAASILRDRPGGGSGGGGGGVHEAFLRTHAAAAAAEAEAAAGGGARAAWPARGRGARQSLAAGFGGSISGGSSGGGGAMFAGGGSGGGLGLSFTPAGVTGASVGLETHLSEAGLQPGVVAVPTRVRRPVRLAAEARAQHDGSSADSGRCLGDERVVSVTCSRHFSVAATAAGEVWSWGADFTGALAQAGGLSWAPSPAPVAGAVAAAIAREGGAVAVEAAGSGVACLTASGRVVVFGALAAAGGGDGAGGGRAAAAADFAVVDLPAPVRSLACGREHAVMTDGERVWAVGRWRDAAGREAGRAPAAAPAELLRLPAEGVAKVVAGAHALGAVSGDGRLFLSGRLLDEAAALAVLQKRRLAQWRRGGGGSVERPGGPAAAAAAGEAAAEAAAFAALASADWGWPGFGGAAMAAVPGVEGVVDAALGGWHALVVTR